MEPEPREVGGVRGEEQRRREGAKLGKDSPGSNPRCSVCVLQLWLSPWDSRWF